MLGVIAKGFTHGEVVARAGEFVNVFNTPVRRHTTPGTEQTMTGQCFVRYLTTWTVFAPKTD